MNSFKPKKEKVFNNWITENCVEHNKSFYFHPNARSGTARFGLQERHFRCRVRRNMLVIDDEVRINKFYFTFDKFLMSIRTDKDFKWDTKYRLTHSKWIEVYYLYMKWLNKKSILGYEPLICEDPKDIQQIVHVIEEQRQGYHYDFCTFFERYKKFCDFICSKYSNKVHTGLFEIHLFSPIQNEMIENPEIKITTDVMLHYSNITKVIGINYSSEIVPKTFNFLNIRIYPESNKGNIVFYKGYTTEAAERKAYDLIGKNPVFVVDKNGPMTFEYLKLDPTFKNQEIVRDFIKGAECTLEQDRTIISQGMHVSCGPSDGYIIKFQGLFYIVDPEYFQRNF